MTYLRELANGLADWDPFRWYAVAALTAFVAQGALIVGFLAQRAARRRAEAALQTSQSALRSRGLHVDALAVRLAGSGPRFGLIVHHTDAEREWAYDRTSHIGQLIRGLDEAQQHGWIVADMKKDWNAIYSFQKP